MAQSKKQLEVQKIRLCAKLAKFAYTSGNPEMKISSDSELAKQTLCDQLATPDSRPEIIDFRRFYSKPWFVSNKNQYRWFRSYSYFCHLKTAENIDRIIVGFRGTWNNPSGTGKWFNENDSKDEGKSWFSRISNLAMNKFAPSNYGLSDFYYDSMLIRIPYRKGTVWKWYAYWGSLILERTRSFRTIFGWPRTVAMNWMFRPHENPVTQQGGGHVHLGFWSLWASPEGFAGYDRDGGLSNDSHVLRHVTQALEEAKNRKTEIFVVGHSLGGAVSCFAALDIAVELEKFTNASMFHVTFGAPPVGTGAFAEYFDQKMRRHQSWNISHCRDMIPKCFAWCGSKWYLGWLHWWDDWSGVGEKRVITKLDGQELSLSEGSRWVRLTNKCIWVTVGVGTVTTLYVSSLLAIPVSALCYLWNWNYFKTKENPAESRNNAQRDTDHLPGNDVGLKYHDLQKYIELLQDETVLEVSGGGEENAPTGGH